MLGHFFFFLRPAFSQGRLGHPWSLEYIFNPNTDFLVDGGGQRSYYNETVAQSCLVSVLTNNMKKMSLFLNAAQCILLFLYIGRLSLCPINVNEEMHKLIEVHTLFTMIWYNNNFVVRPLYGGVKMTKQYSFLKLKLLSLSI